MLKIVKNTQPKVNAENYYKLVNAIAGEVNDTVVYHDAKAERRLLDLLQVVATQFHDGELYNRAYSIEYDIALGKHAEAKHERGLLDDNINYHQKKADPDF